MFLETFWRHGFAKEHYISQDEFESITTEALQFISGLEFTLTQGLPQEKLAMLRQYIEKIQINKPKGQIKMLIHEVSTGNLQTTAEIIISKLLFFFGTATIGTILF